MPALPLLVAAALAASPARVQLAVDASEVEAVLAILARRAAGEPVRDRDWAALLESEPFRRLERREASMKRPLDRDAFKAFVLSSELLRRREALARTLAAWRTADLRASAERVLAYLPPEARIRARVYPVVKPRPNSFVFETETDPAIFLWLDPDVPAARFENTVAHELHHVGLASLGPRYEREISALPEGPRAAALWMGAFGEGLAILAAAGGPDADPQAHASEEVRASWAGAQGTFAADLAALDAFFAAACEGRLAGDALTERAMTFFGDVQGPWYTVGYRMAVAVERRFGRGEVVAAALDPRRLLARWQELAREDPGLPRWSEAVLARVGPPRPPAPPGR